MLTICNPSKSVCVNRSWTYLLARKILMGVSAQPRNRWPVILYQQKPPDENEKGSRFGTLLLDRSSQNILDIQNVAKSHEEFVSYDLRVITEIRSRTVIIRQASIS